MECSEDAGAEEMEQQLGKTAMKEDEKSQTRKVIPLPWKYFRASTMQQR